jgi:hypothetical protein
VKLPLFVPRARVLELIATHARQIDEVQRRRRTMVVALRKETAELNRTKAELAVLRRQGDNAELRAAAAEARYASLVERVMAPAKAPKPFEPPDPEVASLTKIKGDTVERMAESFVKDGMNPQMAQRHAQELADAADAMYFGGGSV